MRTAASFAPARVRLGPRATRVGVSERHARFVLSSPHPVAYGTHRASLLAALQETAQKVVHGAKEMADAAEHRLQEFTDKAGNKPKGQ
jgi:hypothetical protein